MPAALLGRKIGMTRYYIEDGTNIPVTVIEAGPCAVTQVKTTESDGYAPCSSAFDDVQAAPQHDAADRPRCQGGTSPKRFHRELRVERRQGGGEYELGQMVDVSVFEGVPYVDVIGTSKGKGFQGKMKRHNFKGQEASHGVERKHRSSGSIGGHATNRGTGPKLKKGKRMAGHMGDERVTVRNLDVVSIDPEQNLLLVKGPVPGSRRGVLFIREAVRLNRQKARKSGRS